MQAERERNGGVAPQGGTTDGVSCAADTEMKDDERIQTISDDEDVQSIKSGNASDDDVEMIIADGGD